VQEALCLRPVRLSVRVCVRMRRRHSPATLSLTGGYKNCCIIAYFVYICVCFLFTSLYDFVIWIVRSRVTWAYKACELTFVYWMSVWFAVGFLMWYGHGWATAHEVLLRPWWTYTVSSDASCLLNGLPSVEPQVRRTSSDFDGLARFARLCVLYCVA